MTTSKIIKGVVGGGRYTVTAPIIKEDYGLYLQIEGIELPDTYEVDFSNDEHSGTSVTMIGNSDGVLIPSQFIKSGKDVFAFLYHVGDNYGRTVFKFRIPNKLRPDRTDEEPTPEQASTIDQTIAALNDGVSKAQDAQQAIEDMSVSANTLAEGSSATVIKTESGGVVHLDFGIPVGATGAQGERGEKGEKGDTGERGPQVDPQDIADAVDDYMEEHPPVVSATGVVSVADYGAVGDGETDDSAAIQLAVNNSYDVYFESDKTYYIASTINIDHDIKLHGGENTVIKTQSVEGTGYSGIVISGTQKLSTTLTTDYAYQGDTANSYNKLTLASSTGIQIGDIIEITATDQYYSYARQYYYLGGACKVVDIYDGHIYIDKPLPFDIENTAHVSVKVYDAPTVIIENLMFEGDLAPWTSGVYQGPCLVDLRHCIDSKIVNCNFTQFTIGLMLRSCVNTYIDGVTVSKSKYDNTLVGDGYGICVSSCSNTTIQRVISLSAQNAIDLTGTYPCINTFVSKCNLAAECRANGLGLHENSYNLVVEDCTLGGLSLYGTATVNRCSFFQNNRLPTAPEVSVSVRGSHNPDWARFLITNCDFGVKKVFVSSLDYQSGIQPIHSVIGSLTISNCTGGSMAFDASVSENVLSNTINEIILHGWKNCYEIYHPENKGAIKKMRVSQCEFGKPYFINDHNDAHGTVLNDLGYLDLCGTFPLTHKLSVNRDTYGETLVLPKGVSIEVSSSNASAKYIVCGNKLVSNNANDYAVGSVTGSVGGTLHRSVATDNTVGTISINTDGDVVYTQKGNTNKYAVYPIGMVYVEESSMITMSATLVDSGNEGGMEYQPYIAVVDCDTGLIVYRGNGTKVAATQAGASITHEKRVRKNTIVMCYYFCKTPIANAQVTFQNASVEIVSNFAPAVIDTDEDYVAKRLTGDGTIKSLSGVNHIMCSENTFHVKLVADYVNNPIGIDSMDVSQDASGGLLIS